MNSFVNTFLQNFFIGTEQIITHNFCFVSNHIGQIFPSFPVIFSQTIFEQNYLYFPSSHISLAAGSRQILTSLLGVYPALYMVSKIISTACSFDFNQEQIYPHRLHLCLVLLLLKPISRYEILLLPCEWTL